MIRRRILVAAALVWLAPAMAFGAPMANGKHDLSSGSTGPNKSNSQTQLCVFCHTPHNSQPAVARPLWNHSLTAQTLTWSPTTTVRGTTIPTTYATAALAGSQACMSCHDGTLALGALINGSGGTVSPVSGTNVVAGKLVAGVNFINPAAMQSNHPVGVQKPSVATTGLTGFKAVPTGNAVNYDANGYVQCDSCHNPHETGTNMLKIDNSGSQICITCHDL